VGTILSVPGASPGSRPSIRALGHRYADNAVSLAVERDVEMPVRVVAIAATNPNSNCDWLQEDFHVENVLGWTKAFPTLGPYSASSGINPYLSVGTVFGIDNLLALQSGAARVPV
jgi:hypothetical protein